MTASTHHHRRACKCIPAVALRILAILLLVVLLLPFVFAGAGCARKVFPHKGGARMLIPDQRGGHLVVFTGAPNFGNVLRAAKGRAVGADADDDEHPGLMQLMMQAQYDDDMPATSPSTQPVRPCSTQVFDWWIYLTGPDPCAKTARVRAVGFSTTIIVEECLADECDRIYLLWKDGESSADDCVNVYDRATNALIATLQRTSSSRTGETYAKINHGASGPEFESIYSVDAPGSLNRRSFVRAITPEAD
jgi:hypothetical protein